MLVDPAGDPTSQVESKKDSDYVGIVVIGVNPYLDILIRNMIMRRFDPTEAIEAIISMYLQYAPFLIGVEKTGLGTMAHYLREELRKRGRYALVDDLLPGGRSKYQRVIELQPLAKRRKIFIAEESQYQDEFFDQITKVTTGIKSKHDDLIDPTAYIVDMMKKYGTIDFEDVETKFVPPELRGLSQSSQDYWMSVRRQEEKKHRENPMDEFSAS
jgi:predicted phage terminase large subunit-like protein